MARITMTQRFWWIGCGILTIILTAAARGAGLWSEFWSRQGLEIDAAAAITAFCVFWAGFRPSPVRLARIDRRVAAILIATCLSAAATMVGFATGLHDETRGFTKDVFAAWVGGVAFFGFVGALVAVVSLAQSSEEPFDTRARILVRGKSGEHVDSFIEQLKEGLAHYAVSVERVMTIDEFDATTKMYLVRTRVKTTIRSYVDDIPTTYRSSVSYRPDFAPPAGRFHRLSLLMGVMQSRAPIQQSTDAAISHPFSATVPPEKPCVVEFELQVWVKADDENTTYTPVRFTQAVSLTIQNALDRPVSLDMTWSTRAVEAVTLQPGQAHPMWNSTNVHPGERVHLVVLRP